MKDIITEGILDRNRTANDLMEAIKVNKQPAPPSAQFPSGLPLFELAPSVLHEVFAMPGEDVAKMLDDMQTAGVLRLPYDQIAVRFWLPDLKMDAPQTFVTFATKCDVSLLSAKDGDNKLAVVRQKLLIAIDPGTQVDVVVHGYCWIVLTALLIALATRNVVKTTEHNTRIHNKHKKSKEQFRDAHNGTVFISCTKIEPPPAEAMVQEGTGTKRRPHLRRGHVHTVCYGIGRLERRVKWFPAVFVNGDPKHTPAAKRYFVNA
jgi:hypothetical protein